MNGATTKKGSMVRGRLGGGMAAVGRFLYNHSGVTGDFRFHGIIDSHDHFIGHVGEILLDEMGDAAYFTIVNVNDQRTKTQVCPIEFVKTVESGNVYLLADFDDIKNEEFYTLEAVVAREAHRLSFKGQKETIS